MKIDPEDFRVRAGRKLKLSEWPTEVDRFYGSEEDYKEHLAKDVDQLNELQRLISASGSYAALLIFQGMDASGKDGAIRHVLTGINPQGCEVTSFKQPSAEESRHDFLWRTSCRLPARGRIGVFNRSYYEEVLVVKVHPAILKLEGLPDDLTRRRMWRRRYHSIVEFEKHLHRNGTRVIKFFLHLSKAEQRRRFLERIDEPQKNWKFSLSDARERAYWDSYMKAYEECLGATSTGNAPWHVVPADDKLNARLIISRIVISSLKGLRLAYPKMSPERSAELRSIRRQLAR